MTWLLAAEYSRWHSESDSSNPTLFPSELLTISERAYGWPPIA